MLNECDLQKWSNILAATGNGFSAVVADINMSYCESMDRERVVAAAIIQRNSCVLLARRARGENLAGLWEFPGGKVENGETPEQCLARELHEELDVRARIGKKCAESSHQYDHGNFHVVAYFVDRIEGELRSSVHDRLEWVKIGDLSEYQLLPGDIPIAASLLKQQLPG